MNLRPNRPPLEILLIEDNPGDARLIQEMLNDTGAASAYRLRHYSRLSDGLRYLQDHRVDLILSDVVLPDRQGMETVAFLSRAAERLPIVFITGSEDEELGIAAIQQGVQDYLRKGQFDGELLVRSIRYAIERKMLERQKEDFIGVASHELKTPVTSLKGYTQVLQRRMEREGNTSAADLLGRMDGQLNRLSKLINDLLDVTKIEQGQLKMEEAPFDLDPLVAEVVEQVQLTAPRHHIVNRVATSAGVVGDRERFGQVLTNLLTNAVKYSPESAVVEVGGEASADAFAISVRDFGVGIAKDHQGKVFERFYRATGGDDDTYPGLGLGLYIAAEIVRRQGGTISVSSEEGVGSTFTVRMPRRPPPAVVDEGGGAGDA